MRTLCDVRRTSVIYVQTYIIYTYYGKLFFGVVDDFLYLFTLYE